MREDDIGAEAPLGPVSPGVLPLPAIAPAVQEATRRHVGGMRGAQGRVLSSPLLSCGQVKAIVGEKSE